MDREEYDFSKGCKNPYVKRERKPETPDSEIMRELRQAEAEAESTDERFSHIDVMDCLRAVIGALNKTVK